MKAQQLKLKLDAHSCPIIIGEGVVNDLVAMIEKALPSKKSRKIFIIADKDLTKARTQVLKALAKINGSVHEIPVKAGEGLKDIESVFPLYGKLLELKADRQSIIIALGGGTIGDVAGFIAATYMRGISWIGLPTTLLAQVDSSVGGKTGINHSLGKNLIGAFHQPSLVVCETSFLKTLSAREINSGLGEIAKYAITFDPKFFDYLSENLKDLKKLKASVVSHVIKRSLEWKCLCVKQDEYDRLGVREVLNFGHTFGHALEAITDFKKYQHGEAVVWGMRFALALSEIRGHLKSKDRTKMEQLLLKIEVPALPRTLDFKQVMSHMKKDKKAQDNLIRFVLIDRLGQSVSDHMVTDEDLVESFKLLNKVSV
jgi:3-dehydroquinate synthase